MKILVAVLLSLLTFEKLSIKNASAEQYLVSQSSRLYFGGGFNPFAPSEGVRLCVTFDEQAVIQARSVTSTGLRISQVKSLKELYTRLGFSLSLEGSRVFLQQSGSLNSSLSESFDDDSFNILIYHTAEYGRTLMPISGALASQYRGLSMKKLKQTCGTEVVTEVNQGSKVYSLITIKNMSVTAQKNLARKLGLEVGDESWRPDMSEQFSQTMASIASTHSVEFTFDAVGGAGVTKLAALLGSTGQTPQKQELFSLGRIPGVLSDYVSTLTRENAVPVSYITTPIEAFVTEGQLQQLEFKSSVVSDLFSTYEKLRAIVSRVDKVLGPDRENYFLDSSSEAHLVSAQKQARSAMNRVLENGRACFGVSSQEECKNPEFEPVSVRWPPLDEMHLCKKLRDRVYLSGQIDPELYSLAVSHNLAPQLDWNAQGEFTVAGWDRCSSVVAE